MAWARSRARRSFISEMGRSLFQKVGVDFFQGGGVFDGVERPCARLQCGFEGGAVFFQSLHETALGVDAAGAEAEAMGGGGHVEFEIPIGERGVEGNCFPSFAGPEMAGA